MILYHTVNWCRVSEVQQSLVNRHAVIQIHVAARRYELAYRSRHTRQLIALEAQHLQFRELPDIRRHARQLIAAEVQPFQRPQLLDLGRHTRKAISAEPQRRLQRAQYVMIRPVLIKYLIISSLLLVPLEVRYLLFELTKVHTFVRTNEDNI